MRQLTIAGTALAIAVGVEARAGVIPVEVKQAVVFIYVAGPKGDRVPVGTGFLVSVPDAVTDGRIWSYLVVLSEHVVH